MKPRRKRSTRLKGWVPEAVALAAAAAAAVVVVVAAARAGGGACGSGRAV